MNEIEIYRNGTIFRKVKPDPNAVQVKRIMQENELRFTVKESVYIDFSINDYCTVFAETYRLINLPIVKKLSSNYYEYSFTMLGTQGDLAKAQFLFLGAANDLRESYFSLMGNVETFLNLIIQNANRVSPTWVKGQFEITEYKNLTFSKENCFEALQRVAEAFSTEFWVLGKTVHITKKSVDRGFTFKVGQHKGLYELVRLNQNNSNIVTRLYAYGSDRNLPADYRNYSKRLMFPAGVDACLPHDVLYTVTPIGGGMQTITFTWGFAPIGLNIGIIYKPATGSTGWLYNWGLTSSPRSITVPVGNYDVRFRALGGICGIVASPIFQVTGTITTPIFPYTPFPFLEQNVSLYGVIEHTEIFEDIYPHRTGKVTSIDAGNIYRFFDTSMDFDINAQLLPGLTAKVTFNTGQLAGYTFEIVTYNNATKEFIIAQNKDERVLDIPNSAIKPGIGDTYVITDIAMPAIYITKAENELLAKAQEFLNTKSVPQVMYQLTLDPVKVRDNKIPVELADEVWLEDTEMNIQQKIRITAVTRNIIEENEYQIEISNAVIKPRIVNAETAIRTVDRRVQDITRRLIRLGDLIPP